MIDLLYILDYICFSHSSDRSSLMNAESMKPRVKDNIIIYIYMCVYVCVCIGATFLQ